MRAFLRGLFILAALGVLFTSINFYLYLKPRNAPTQTVIIPPHTGARAAFAMLHQAGLTPNLVWIVIPITLDHAFGRLKAGEYEFTAGMSPAQIIGKLLRGDIVVHKVTVPEGWNIFQVRAALAAEPLLTGELPVVLAEGSILPDTYRFTRGETRQMVLARMQHARDELLGTLWTARAPNLPVATPQEALTLASIVERETGVGQERPLIAGVFVNRLRLNMPLQTDPTVAYGVILAHGGVAMDRPLSTADLKTDTAYNTYTRAGLPPTPICNPGRDALLAALHPADTPALYFVATGHGGHHFAATLEEHTRNVALYRQSQHSN